MANRCSVCGAPYAAGQTTCEFCGTALPSAEERVTGAGATDGADLITRKIIEKVQGCVLKISTPTSTGTGFVTRDGKIVSNAHVVVNSHRDADKKITVILKGGAWANFYKSEEKHPLRILSYDEREDVAVLEFEDGTQCSDYLELADSDEVKMGERIFTIGNPLGYEFSYAEGTVGSPYRKFGDRNNAVLQMQLAVNPGNSGGPVCNSRGEVVGIASFFRFNRAAWSNQIEKDDGISFAVTAKTIQQEIDKTR